MNGRKVFKTLDNHLYIGNVDCCELVKKYNTPLYVMDKSKIEKMCKTYTETLSKEYGEGLICYASKAFCTKEIYRIINSFSMGADAVSLGEIATAKSAKFPLEKIIFHGNNKTLEELEYAVKNKVGLIVIDSFDEVDNLSTLCNKYKTCQDVLIRVNPGIEAHTHKFIQTSTPDSKFGFSIANGDSDKIIDYVLSKGNLNLKGLHSHIGSQIFDVNSYILAIDVLTDYYKKLSNDGVNFEILNLGGGFGIWYNFEDRELSYEDYADFVKSISKHLTKCVEEKSVKKPKLILEPGRSIVGEAGVTLYQVGSVKKIKGLKNYVSVDGGMFENPRFALYQAKYTVDLANKINDKPNKTYSIVGKCCESGDVIAENCKLPNVEAGDVLAVYSTGAYNYSMASNYNRNLVPPVILVDDDKTKVIVKRQSLRQLLKNDI